MHMSRGRGFGTAFLVVMTIAGCTAPRDTLESAKQSCDRALERLASADRCDAYVAAAVQSKDKNAIFAAYTDRAALREFRGDLPGALADADRAVEILPDDSFGNRRRATLLGESGEYAEALALFAKFPSSGPPSGFEENMAMLEYVAGDRARSVSLFQSAAIDYAKNDHNENMAAIYRFTAAIIESELKGGDLAPIAAQDVSARTDTMLPLLKRHRLGEISDADLIARVAKTTGPAAIDNICYGYFSVGHRNAVAGNAAAARQAFQVVVERCSVIMFEYHAAKTWLAALGA